jgi:hypothetical protein
MVNGTLFAAIDASFATLIQSIAAPIWLNPFVTGGDYLPGSPLY